MNNAELAVVKEESQEVDHMKMSRLDDSLFSKDLAPHYMKLAGQLAASSLVPKSFQNKPQDLFICWAMGYQIGLTPEQSMQCIAVINGKPAMWGDDMLALCMVHKDFEDIIEEPILAKDGSIFGYTCTVTRKGRAPKINKFDLNDAKKAGLLAKGGVWNQYTERMLKLRARGFTLRDAFPDALKGIKSREEVEDYIDADYTVTDTKGISRTELLKQDFLSKKGVSNVDAAYGFTSGNEDKESGQENTHNDQPLQEVKVGEEEAEMHSEIRRLIDEKAISEKVIAKALNYYEVSSIDDLSVETGIHFINHLVKL